MDLTGSSIGLLNGVRISFKSVESSLVRLSLHMVLESLGVNKILGAVDAVELSQAGLVKVHFLGEKLLDFALSEICVDLIQVSRPALSSPTLFQVGVPIMVLLPLVRTTHVFRPRVTSAKAQNSSIVASMM